MRFQQLFVHKPFHIDHRETSPLRRKYNSSQRKEELAMVTHVVRKLGLIGLLGNEYVILDGTVSIVLSNSVQAINRKPDAERKSSNSMDFFFFLLQVIALVKVLINASIQYIMVLIILNKKSITFIHFQFLEAGAIMLPGIFRIKHKCAGVFFRYDFKKRKQNYNFFTIKLCQKQLFKLKE